MTDEPKPPVKKRTALHIAKAVSEALIDSTDFWDVVNKRIADTIQKSAEMDEAVIIVENGRPEALVSFCDPDIVVLQRILLGALDDYPGAASPAEPHIVESLREQAEGWRKFADMVVKHADEAQALYDASKPIAPAPARLDFENACPTCGPTCCC